MGVSGSGKTTVGTAVAAQLGLPFIEGDRLHPATNIEKMSRGIALDDADRWPWLDAVAQALAASAAKSNGAIAACSALKRSYRDHLRQGVGSNLRFIFLDVSRDELERRMSLREGHFMPATLLESQLATLERPANEAGTLTVDGGASPEEIVRVAVSWLRERDDG